MCVELVSAAGVPELYLSGEGRGRGACSSAATAGHSAPPHTVRAATPLDTKLLIFKPFLYPTTKNKNDALLKLFNNIFEYIKILSSLAATCLINCNSLVTLSTLPCLLFLQPKTIIDIMLIHSTILSMRISRSCKAGVG